MGDEHGRNGFVVRRQIGFGDAIVGKKDLLGMGDDGRWPMRVLIAHVCLDAVTRLVAANGLPYQKRQPSRRRVTSVAPSFASVAAYRPVARIAAMAKRPPGLSTRHASATASARAAFERML